MTKDLLLALGPYVGAFVVSFIAGLFPIFSIELFLVLVSTFMKPPFEELLLCCLIAAVSHQIAKTITYYAGVGALEHGKLKAKIEKHRDRIDRWNKAPKLIMFVGSAVGIPPLYLLGFIAHPIMRMRFWTFTAIVFAGRIVRFVTLVSVPLLFR